MTTITVNNANERGAWNRQSEETETPTFDFSSLSNMDARGGGGGGSGCGSNGPGSKDYTEHNSKQTCTVKLPCNVFLGTKRIGTLYVECFTF